MTKLTKYIENQGGILSGHLAKYLIETQKISETAARKRIERVENSINKLTGLFADNQAFLYHQSKYNSEAYFDKLTEAFKTSGKRCFSFITAIKYHHGVIAKTELPNYTFCSLKKIKGQMLFSTLLDKLIKANVLFEYDDFNYYLNPNISKLQEPNFRHSKAIQFAKDLVIHQFTTWSKNIGLCSYNINSTNSEVGGFQFALTSVTYLNGFVQYKESKPVGGFLVADILIGNSTTDIEIDFFLQKIASIRASHSSIRLLPVLIVDGVKNSAFNKLKSAGILIASIREIFGESYQDLLKNLINSLENAGAILKKEPDKYLELMNQLRKLIHGKTNNLRGDLFELAVGYYYSQKCQSLDIGKKLPPDIDPRRREMDVIASYSDEIRVIECKGYNNRIDREYIQKYLNEKIPAIRKWMDIVHRDKKQVFEIWSTGGFDPESISILEKAKDTKKYSFDYFDKSEILKKAEELKSSKFKEIMNDYFVKEIV